MPTRNLDSLFHPRSIAVIGASNRPDTIGATLFQNVAAAFQGAAYPVNPKYDHIQGVPAFRSIDQLPQPPDLAIVAIPASQVAQAIAELGELGTRAAIVISAGFREVGPAGQQLEEQLEATRRKYDGFRILGPNCLGYLVPKLKLNASFASGLPRTGQVAFLSQSGALCSAILDWALARDIGFSYFISLGNLLDVSFADVIDFLADDDDTRALVLYIESVINARDFLSAARAFTRRKPIVVYKAGRFAESAQAAASHTGALAGLDAAYDAGFRRGAMVRVFDSGQLFDAAELLACSTPPTGSRLAILTNAGGPGVMATDALVAGAGQLAKLTDRTISALDELLPPAWSHRNPVDVLGDATPDRFARAAELILRDEEVDGLLAILTPQAMTRPTETADSFARAVVGQRRPVLAAWMGGREVREGRQRLNQSGIPGFDTPEQAVRSFLYLASYARDLELLYQAPRAVPLRCKLGRKERRERIDRVICGRKTVLTEPESKAILNAYEIPVTNTVIARDEQELAQVLQHLDFPIVMKILSPDISHKSDAGGVRVNIQTPDEAKAAYRQMIADVSKARPAARVHGVTLQRYVVATYGTELILGTRRDPVFGPVIMLGLGGIATEIFRDCSFELPPLDERLTVRMLQRLRSWPLLDGYRGRPRLAIERLVETALRFSTLVVECPELAECDINPLVLTPDEVIALDARMSIDPQFATPARRPFAHLAIAPYPEEYCQQLVLKDRTPVVLRPIRPEDEPLWHQLLDAASDKAIWRRFRSLFRGSIHRQASRYCFIDYDREMAFVAEIEIASKPQLIGVARLVADRNHQNAEFAVLVLDSWQRRGLGRILLKACVDYAKTAGLERIYAETGWDNAPMLALFRSFGFELHRDERDATTVIASLNIVVPK